MDDRIRQVGEHPVIQASPRTVSAMSHGLDWLEMVRESPKRVSGGEADGMRARVRDH